MSLKARLLPLVQRVKNEPVAVANGAAGVLALATSFGLPLSPDQKIELAGAFVGLGNWWARSQVVPTNKLIAGTVLPSSPGEPVIIESPTGGSDTVVGGAS